MRCARLRSGTSRAANTGGGSRASQARDKEGQGEKVQVVADGMTVELIVPYRQINQPCPCFGFSHKMPLLLLAPAAAADQVLAAGTMAAACCWKLLLANSIRC